MIIYTEIIATGAKVSNHSSDLYAEATPEVLAILKAHNSKSHSLFTNRVEGGQWVDIPFAYDPWWEAKDTERLAASWWGSLSINEQNEMISKHLGADFPVVVAIHNFKNILEMYTKENSRKED